MNNSELVEGNRHLVMSVLFVLFAVSSANAAMIVNGSSLLSQQDADQLETWLGEGPLTLTNIFSRTSGDGKTSADFHAVTDGTGRTIVVLEVTDGFGGEQIIGGYNPQSWSSSGSFNETPQLDDRMAFLFNLTNTTVGIVRQTLDSANGDLQTFNHISYGPTFGGGHDLYVDSTLGGGSAFDSDYGEIAGTSGANIVGDFGNSPSPLTYGVIEVFTVTTIPEPASIIAFAGLALCLGAAAWWRQAQAARR